MKPNVAHIVLTVLGCAGAVAAFLAKSSTGQLASYAALAASVIALVGSQLNSSLVASVNVAAAARAKAALVKGVAGLCLMLFAFTCLTTGCAWFRANESTLTADGEQLAACIVGEAIYGDTSAATIALKCAAPAGFDVLGFLGQILAKAEAPGDAGLVGLSPDRAAFIRALRAVH